MPPTTRMPRQQRRTQLLEIATRVFTEKGYQRASMDDIATAAGVTKPVLYQHFETKETLYAEVIDITADTLLAEVRSLGRIDGSTTDRVRQGLERFYQLVTLDNSLRLFTGREEVSATVQERATAVLDAMAIELAGVLSASRRLTTQQARVIGRGLITLTQTTAMMLHEARDEAERMEILEVMTQVAVRGLTGFEPREHPEVTGTVLSRSDG